MNKQFIISFLLVVVLLTLSSCDKSSKVDQSPLFSQNSSNRSGITFSNDLKEDMSSLANVLDFDFFYNGAGVGVGDFNNDGLYDVFFAGNQVNNELYLNEGELKFRNISPSAGISAQGKWCNGVSIIDINEDGYDDIYVSVGGPTRNSEERKNLLFINNQDLTFTESAESFDLADAGFSTQTLFIDFDNDGDMDAFVGNESYLYGYDPLTFFQKVGSSESVLHENSSHYYRNDNGSFVDITKESGLLKPSFALGLISNDFNNDGAMDIYIANDYFIPDALYINQKDGSFKDETKSYFNQIAFFGMGVDIGDLNKDGHEDVFVADMASADHVRSKTLMESMDVNAFRFLTESLNFPYQYMFNSVQLNNGQGHFNNVASKLGLKSEEWGLDIPTYSNGSVSADLDNDGDLDIIVNNIDAEASLFENHAANNGNASIKIKAADTSKNHSFTVELVNSDGQMITQSARKVKGYFSSFANEVVLSRPENLQKIIVKWYDGSRQSFDAKEVGSTLILKKEDAIDDVESDGVLESLKAKKLFAGNSPIHQENKFDDFQKEVLLPYKQSSFGPLLSSSDGQGNEDWIYIGGAAGYAGQLYERQGKTYESRSIAVFEKDKQSEDLGSVFFDYDNDGDQDLFVVSGGNEFKSGSLALRDRLYRNDGDSFKRVRMQAIDELRHSGKAVAAADLDNDGYTDLVVGNRMVPHQYPLPEPSYILWNRKGLFEKEDLTSLIDNFEDNIVNDVSIDDVNHDGRPDILLVGEWSEPKLLLSTEDSWMQSVELPSNKGLWFSSAFADVNNDGIKDIILGNIGQNSKYSATGEKPLRIYAGNIDDNGSWDMYLSKKWNGKFVPFRGKECSTEQMPFVSEKFPTYEGFAQAEIEDIIGAGAQEDLYQSEVSSLSSIVLIGDDKGGYSSVKLPFDAQLLPILDIEVAESSDGSAPKVIVVGNIYDTEVETPRLDFRGGLVLQYNEKAGIFEKVNTLPFEGDAKSVLITKSDLIGELICVGTNNGPIFTFELK